jgi:hypothetical protein
MPNLNRAQFIFAKNLSKLIDYIFETGYQCSIGEVLRTREQAMIYVKQGIGIKDSLHCYKLAADINLFRFNDYITDPESYRKFGEFWKKLNPLNRWGGDFEKVDATHFEMNAKEGVE